MPKKLTIGILAHVDSGKTTLSEAMLFASGKIRKLGRVDHGNAFLDTHKLERNRGITIFSKQARLNFGETEIDLLDTPGHVDFSTEAERALQVLDYAILVISAIDGVQAHTQTLWSLLYRYNIPTFIFVNKMDISSFEKSELSENIRKNLSENAIDFDCDNLEESIAMCNDELTQEFLENLSLKQSSIIKAIKNRAVFPCFYGSALKLDGIEEFMNSFDKFTLASQYGNKFGARVFKISWDNMGNRLTHLKITGGSLKVKSVIFHKDKEQIDREEKVDQIRRYSGSKFELSMEVFAGEICVVTGLLSSYAGQGFGFEEKANTPMLEPILVYKVMLPKGIDSVRALANLRLLEQEDPELRVMWSESLKEIQVRLMGAIQVEVLQSLIEERFGYLVEFDKGNIVYKETIIEQVIGMGHFEPLKHYAEVHLKLEPMPRGSGIYVDNKAKHDLFDKNWQNLVLTHILEKNHTGVLTNSPVTDIKITLVDGRGHVKHTTGGDFRQATYRAFRHGLMRAKSILLEPVYAFKLEVSSEYVGKAISDIQQMGGSFNTPETVGDFTIISGLLPAATSIDYSKEVIRYTKGLGKYSYYYNGYDKCHNSEEVIKAFSYDAENDPENPSASVFCSHGSGFIVKWDKAEEYMHIKSEKEKDIQEIKSAKRAGAIYDKGLAIQDDKELLSIFESTYGKIKTDPRVTFSSPIKSKSNINYKRHKSTHIGPEYILVDGYNIIFAWQELNELAKINIDAARNKLIDILTNYAAYKNCDLILVFDAYKVKGNKETIVKHDNISVVYTKEAETADMYIEKVTKKMSDKYRVRVATSDAVEQMIVLGNGALRVSANGFREEILSAEKEIRDLIK